MSLIIKNYYFFIYYLYIRVIINFVVFFFSVFIIHALTVYIYIYEKQSLIFLNKFIVLSLSVHNNTCHTIYL